MSPAIQDVGLEFTLNHIDYDLCRPTSLDQRRSPLDSLEAFHQLVPVIRIYGRTDAGQNVCALVHGVYPYMFVEYDGPMDNQSSKHSDTTWSGDFETDGDSSARRVSQASSESQCHARNDL